MQMSSIKTHNLAVPIARPLQWRGTKFDFLCSVNHLLVRGGVAQFGYREISRNWPLKTVIWDLFEKSFGWYRPDKFATKADNHLKQQIHTMQTHSLAEISDETAIKHRSDCLFMCIVCISQCVRENDPLRIIVIAVLGKSVFCSSSA